MHFRQGFRDWWNGLTRIATETGGIERVVGITLVCPDASFADAMGAHRI
jgi:hypothetical protein